MESGEAPQTGAGQTNPGQAGSLATVPFEVVRRAEFVFEPFVGSLIQLPEAGAHRAQGSEFFLPQSPLQAREIESPAGAVEESVASERPFAIPETAVALSATALEQSQKSLEQKTEEVEEGARSYSPAPVRFFDPIAAGGQSKAADLPEPTGARPSTQLSPELKAAILGVEEERRRRQKKKEEPPKEEKRKLPKPPLEKSGKVPKVQDREDVYEISTSERTARWEEISAARNRVDAEQIAPASAAMAPARESATEPVPVKEQALSPEKHPTAEHAAPLVEEPAAAFASLENRLAAQRKQRPVAEVKSQAAEPVRSFAEMKEETARDARSLTEIESAFQRRRLEQQSREIEDEREARKSKKKLPMTKRFRQWLGGASPMLGGSSRRAQRITLPGLVAFYWSGGTPRPHEIVNISKTGFYMKTTELWSVETLVRMTLQKQGSDEKRTRETVSVLARVVRIDGGGVGHEFVTTEALMAARSLDVMPSQGTDWRELDRFLEAK